MSEFDLKKLSNLTQLEGDNVDNFLIDTATELLDLIIRTEHKKQVIYYLGVVKIISFRVPDITLQIINSILEKYSVANYDQLVETCCELLIDIRYLKPREVIAVVLQIVDRYPLDDKKIAQHFDPRKKALEVINKLATYNIHAVNHPQIGIGPQRVILEEILSWSEEKQDRYREIVLMILERIVYVAVEGMSQTEVDTYTISRGALVPSEQVYTLRQKSLELVFAMYTRAADVPTRLSILHVIERALDIPDATDAKNNEALRDMVLADLTERILPWYTEQLFDATGAIHAPYPIVHAIEVQMWRFVANPDHYTIPELDVFLGKIQSDDMYQLYKILTSDRLEYKEREKKEKEVEEIEQEINMDTIGEWINRLSLVTKDFDVLERWQLHRYETLIEDIVWKCDIGIAKKLVAVVQDGVLPKRTMWSILRGLRVSLDEDKLKLWDDITSSILKQGNVQDLIYIVSSLNQKTQGTYTLRNKDVDLLRDIIHKGELSKHVGEDLNNQVLRDQVVRVLCLLLLQDTIKRTEVEELIMAEMSTYPEYLHIYFNQLWLTLLDQDEVIDALSQKFKQHLLDQLVEVRRLQYGEEIVLLLLGKQDVSAIFDVFVRRIKREVEEGKKNDTEDNFFEVMKRYDAIPYDLHHDLAECITSADDYTSNMIQAIETLRDEDIVMFRITSLYKALPTSKNKDVILYFAKKKTEDDIYTAIHLAGVVGKEASFEICVEIYRYILEMDNEEIKEDLVGTLKGVMQNTGVVSGYDGFVKVFLSKANTMKQLAVEEKNDMVKQFCLDMEEFFKKRAEEEKIEAEEEKTIRKIRFESGI